MSACFKDFDFGITEFVSVGLYCSWCCCFYIITVAVNFSVIIIIICISNIIVIIVITLALFFCFALFQCYRFVSILPILIIEVEPCTIRNLNNLVPSIGILILYDFQNEICTKKYCELIKAVVEIFSL